MDVTGGLRYVVGGGLVLAAGTGIAVGLLLVLQSAWGVLLAVGSAAALFVGVYVTPVGKRRLDTLLGREFGWVGATAIAVVLLGAAVVLSTTSIIAVGLTASSDKPPGADVANVSVTATDADVQSERVLDVTWTSRAQSGVDPNPDDYSSYSADEGEKFVVFRMAIKNTGSEPVDLTPRLFKLDVDSVVYDHQSLFGSSGGLGQVELEPGGEFTGWIAFTVDAGTTEAELVVNQDAYYNTRVRVTFDHNPGMEIGVED